MQTDAIGSVAGRSNGGASNAAAALGGEDFFNLMIAQLVNQDPLEPTSNQELLNQIASIREIELSSNLSESLQNLSKQQRFSGAGGLIGQHVSGKNRDGEPVAGVVSAVRFDAQGNVTLELEDGSTLPLEGVDGVLSAEQAARELVGRVVVGVDKSAPAAPRTVEGLVMEVAKNPAGEVVLELDTGEQLRLRDVVEVTDAAA